MAYLICGAEGRRWTGADWIVRNAVELMLPALETAAPHLARAWAAAARDPRRVVSLADLLDDERAAAAWRFAAETARRATRAERAEAWYRPDLRAAFEASLDALAALARPDGNELLADLAVSFGVEDRKVFRDPPDVRHDLC